MRLSEATQKIFLPSPSGRRAGDEGLAEQSKNLPPFSLWEKGWG
jgi:hypothetical protein